MKLLNRRSIAEKRTNSKATFSNEESKKGSIRGVSPCGAPAPGPRLAAASCGLAAPARRRAAPGPSPEPWRCAAAPPGPCARAPPPSTARALASLRLPRTRQCERQRAASPSHGTSLDGHCDALPTALSPSGTIIPSRSPFLKTASVPASQSSAMPIRSPSTAPRWPSHFWSSCSPEQCDPSASERPRKHECSSERIGCVVPWTKSPFWASNPQPSSVCRTLPPSLGCSRRRPTPSTTPATPRTSVNSALHNHLLASGPTFVCASRRPAGLTSACRGA